MSSPSTHHRIAVFAPGGVGDASSGMHIPALRNLIQGLADTNDVSVYSLARPDWRETLGACGKARVRFLPSDHRGSTLTKIWRLCNMCFRDHRSMPFDIVHGFWAIPCGVAAVLFGKLLHIPGVVTFMGGETASLPEIRYGNMARFSTKHITLWVAKLADELVTLTHQQESELRQYGFTRGNVSIIPLGVDTGNFAPQEKDIRIRPLRFLHVSNINPLKDQPTLLRTFQLVCERIDSRLRIIGSDQSNGKIRQLANDLGLTDKVEFVGHVSYREMPAHYHWAHFLIHTSKHEAGVLVVAEAAATGVLVAGTRTGLIADFGDEMAIVSGIGDYRRLSEGILSAIADPQRYDALRYAAQQWALAHDLRWTIDQYLDLFKKIGLQ